LAELLIPDVDEGVVARLAEAASQRGLDFEGCVRDLIEQFARELTANASNASSSTNPDNH
jgi:hypothetical protein